MTIIDLSHAITMAMPSYPGTEPPVIESVATLAGQGYAEQRIALNSHTGTHIDAPAHIIPGGRNLDGFGLDSFWGPVCAVDMTGHRPGRIELAALRAYENLIGRSEFVLLRTGWSRYWGTAEYFAGYPVLSLEAAAWLSRFALKGVGIDASSVDAAEDTAYPVHRSLLAQNILIIENLTNLAAVPKEQFTFLCLPLKIADADGAPVRAVAFWA